MELQNWIIATNVPVGYQVFIPVKKTAMEYGMVMHIGMNAEVVTVTLQMTALRTLMVFGAVMVKLIIVISVVIIPIMTVPETAIMYGEVQLL